MPLSTEDRLALHELYARYAHAFDGGDAEAWSALFAPDASFILPDGSSLTGTAALREFVVTRTAETPGMKHLMTNVLVEEAAGGARGTAYFFALRLGGDGQVRMQNFGRYEDVFVPADGGWLFRSRRVVSELPLELVGAAFAFTL